VIFISIINNSTTRADNEGGRGKVFGVGFLKISLQICQSLQAGNSNLGLGCCLKNRDDCVSNVDIWELVEGGRGSV
jgi:hypothetical protein